MYQLKNKIGIYGVATKKSLKVDFLVAPGVLKGEKYQKLEIFDAFHL